MFVAIYKRKRVKGRKFCSPEPITREPQASCWFSFGLGYGFWGKTTMKRPGGLRNTTCKGGNLEGKRSHMWNHHSQILFNLLYPHAFKKSSVIFIPNQSTLERMKSFFSQIHPSRTIFTLLVKVALIIKNVDFQTNALCPLLLYDCGTFLNTVPKPTKKKSIYSCYFTSQVQRINCSPQCCYMQ